LDKLIWELKKQALPTEPPPLPTRLSSAQALQNKGDELRELARFGTAAEPALREQVAVALRNKGFRLGTLGRNEEEIAVYDDLLARFGTATEPALREKVAMALRYKGVTLGELGRSEEAIAVYDDLLARFGTATEPALREQVAAAKSARNRFRYS